MKLTDRLAVGALVAGGAAILAAAPASAQIAPKDFYAAVGATFTGEPTTIGVSGRIGANLVDQWGVEGDLMIGLAGDDYGLGGTFKTDFLFGVFGTYTYPLDEQVSVYARLGLAGYSWSWEQYSSYDVTNFGLGVGVGVDYRLTGVGKLRADATSYNGQSAITGAYVFDF